MKTHYLLLAVAVAVLIVNQPAEGQSTNPAVPQLTIQGRPVSTWFNEAEIQNFAERPLRVLIDAGPKVIPQLSPLLQDDKAPGTQAKAAFVISCVAHHHPSSVEAHAVVSMLTETAQSADDEVRVYSAQTLAAIGRDASNAIPVLVRLSKDKNEGVRISAVDALGRVSETVAALKMALSDESSDVQFTARQALGIIPRDGK